MAPKVSIIIPCYNQGFFLMEAIKNLSPSNNLFEVIIVDDGSTDHETKLVFSELKEKGYRIEHQTNKGLSEARNTGISLAQGKYIMLLDADNKLEPQFLEMAVNEFESNDQISVVYSDAMYFGKKNKYWEVGEFNLQRLMIANYIDACAMVRKTVFTKIGGYDSNMKGGWEDWEMWLRIAFSGHKFKYVPVVGFWYRTMGDKSMSGGLGKLTRTRNNLKEYLHKKYPSLLGHDYITASVITRLKKNPIKFLTKMIIVAWFPKLYKKLLRENKVIRGL